jgi:16S rRNA (cytosine967-C5)-methyltransferase
MLRAAATLTVPGGALIYAVCSVEPEEGVDVVNRFLSEHAEFEPVDARRFLPTPGAALVGEDGYLRTMEAEGELDGFFAARLRRREGAA